MDHSRPHCFLNVSDQQAATQFRRSAYMFNVYAVVKMPAHLVASELHLYRVPREFFIKRARIALVQSQTQSATLTTAEFGPFDPLFWGTTHLQLRLPVSMPASSAVEPYAISLI
jgi:hypothetical protein